MENPIQQNNILNFNPNCPSENRHPVGARPSTELRTGLLAKLSQIYASKLAPTMVFWPNGLSLVKPQAPNTHRIAVVTRIKNHIPQSVALNGNNYPIAGYLSTQPTLAPGMKIGDEVYITMEKKGVLIHGIVMPPDAQVQASFTHVEGKLVIEAQGAVILKNGKATLELTEAGEIRIDGKNVRTVAEETLTLLGGKVELN